jgi:hypothetical protein
MYKLLSPHEITGEPITAVKRLADNAFIPFDPANTDFQTFKRNLANGVALSDAEGTAMTADQIKTFLETLP